MAGDEQIVEGSAALGQTDSGWSANLHIGRYGDDTLLRAAVARVGWGANVADEAVYPVARVDEDGNPLDGSATYRITFPADELPPVERASGRCRSTARTCSSRSTCSGRYTIGDRTPGLTLGDDGSLEIVLSHDEPAVADRAGRQLAPGACGAVRADAPPLPAGPAVLDGDYAYPPVRPIGAAG